MPKKPEPPPPEQGLPNWFATFADMMTLLLAFFVLLAAISTIDPVKLQAMSEAMGKSVGKTKKIQGAMSLADIEKAVNMTIKQEQMEEAVEVTTSPKGVTIGISSDISFESGSADLKTGIIPILEKIVPTIQESYFQVAVEGHTDNVPISAKIRERFPSNWELSSARAASVVREFIRLGIDPTRLQSVGYAEFIPRDRPTDQLITAELIWKLNVTPELQSRNRRVEITFLAPHGGPVGATVEEKAGE